MSLTLAEAAKYSNDVLQRGVIELIVRDDPVLERLPFKDIIGNGLTYNVETTESGADFLDINETVPESTGTVTPTTVVAKRLMGDADVDNYLKLTRSNFNDLMAEQIEAKTKAIRYEFNRTLLYGYASTETKRFDGIQYLVRDATYNSIAVGTSGTPTALSLERAEASLDMIKDGKASIVMITKQLRRSINKYLNGVGGITKTEIQGKSVQTLFDIPVVVSDYLSNDESCNLLYGSTYYGFQPTDGTALGTDQNSTTLFWIQFGDRALCGLQAGGGITVKRVADDLEAKDSARVRIKWYPAIMLQSIITCAKTTGISPTGTVTA